MLNQRLALLLTVLCLSVLASMLLFLPAKSISSPTNLTGLEENQKVSVSGIVTKEQIYAETRTLTLDNKLSLSCGCLDTVSLKNKRIKAEARFSSFGRRITLEVTKLEVLS